MELYPGQRSENLKRCGYQRNDCSRTQETRNADNRAMHSTQERPGAKEADGVGHRQAPKRNADKIFFLVDGTKRWVCDPFGGRLNHRRQPETPDSVGTDLTIGWLKVADQTEPFPGQARHVRASGQPRGSDDGSSSNASSSSLNPSKPSLLPPPTPGTSVPTRSIVVGIQ
ncbi:hypothetical protein ASPFODRAFT_64185 [Aspergillus luchuensis CBS 106.47]|uniref:Uncharacterized protein n=1 Tax=Aspergillus luchuensis (strain CBS 106.47) TaxID=1137211 RepID=A0A1M3T614_ASPLC|nr:hypothetical protein ASPFODRAFT_64185 [Aspergillus luchuensis CBS 106.47]